MVYYPVELLKKSRGTERLVITLSEQQPIFKKYLSDGFQMGINLSYAIQKDPNGMAEAITIGKDFLANDDVCLITGYTIILGTSIILQLQKALPAVEKSGSTTIFVSTDTDEDQYDKVV
jgi:glucose-1-phosphate thymidylyltransferase